MARSSYTIGPRATPTVDGDRVYVPGAMGALLCLRTATGEGVRWATGFLVRRQDRYFLNNDRGELIICRLTPRGYQEISRTRLIRPTTTARIGRRSAGAVNWSHPAYANRHTFARNDEEILSASLAQESGT